jgi:hypothetical protein
LRETSLERPSVDLKRKTAEVSSWPSSRKACARVKAARKDSAVHVSLSSDSLVKQQPLAHSTRRREHGHEHGRLGHRVNSEGLRGRANAPRRRRTQEDLYRVRQRFLSTFPSAMQQKKAAILAGFCHLRSAIFTTAARLAQGFTPRRWTIGEFAAYSHAAPPSAVLGSTWPYLALLGPTWPYTAPLGPHSSADPCTIRRVSRTGVSDSIT